MELHNIKMYNLFIYIYWILHILTTNLAACVCVCVLNI